MIYTRLNQWEEAERCLEKARRIAGQIGDHRLEGSASLNLGNNRNACGDWIQAMDCYQAALNIAQEVGDRHLKAKALGNLGRTFAHQGYFQAALDQYEKVLEPLREMGSRQEEAITLSNMANSYAGLGQFEQALVHYNQALSMARDLDNPDLFARALAGRGHTYVRMERYADACADYRGSIAHIEAIRGGLLEEEHRVGYFGWDKMAVYRSLVLLLATHDRCWSPGEALATVERSRSRAFLDQLGYTELSAPREADAVLLARERKLAASLREQAVATRQAKTEEHKQKLVAQMARLQTEWNACLDQMQKQAREYVALRRGTPVSWEDSLKCLTSI